MGWTTPRTWTAAATLTAAQLNTDVRDNMNFLKSGVRATATANITGITTSEVSLVAAPAITGDGSTVWRIIVSWNGMQSTVIGDTWEVRIKDSTTQLAAQRLLNTKVSATEAGGTLMTTDVPTAASHTYTAYAVRVGGTGTGIWAAAATFPLTIAVDPIG